MGWQLYWASLLIAAPAMVALVVARVVWDGNDQPGARPLFVLILAAGWWSLTSAIGHASTELTVKLLAFNSSYLGIAVVPVAWLVFATEYTGHHRHPGRIGLGLLSVVPGITAVLALTDHRHEYFRSSAELVESGGAVMLETTPATWFWFWSAYAYLLIAIGAILLLRRVVTSETLFRDQAALLIVASALPLGGNALYLSGITGTVDFTPVSFIGSGMLLGIAIFRRKLLEFVPPGWQKAREEIIARMQDAVIVVDNRNRVIYANPAAESVAPDPAALGPGRPLGAAFPALAGAIARDRGKSIRREVNDIGRDGDRHYELQAVPLKRLGYIPSGQLITLRDVTQRIHREEELRRRGEALQVLNRVLRHDIRNGMQVIMLRLDRLAQSDGVDPDEIRAIKARCRDIVKLGERARTAEACLRSEEVPREPLDVAAELEDVVTHLSREYPDADFTVIVDDERRLLTSELVPLAIRQVIENAIVHHDGSEATVEIIVSRWRDGSLVIDIADDGPGIPTAERSVIETAAETPLEHSSGVGLWLVKWILEDANGRLEIADNDPRGTVITMTLPDLGVDVREDSRWNLWRGRPATDSTRDDDQH